MKTAINLNTITSGKSHIACSLKIQQTFRNIQRCRNREILILNDTYDQRITDERMIERRVLKSSDDFNYQTNPMRSRENEVYMPISS